MALNLMEISSNKAFAADRKKPRPLKSGVRKGGKTMGLRSFLKAMFARSEYDQHSDKLSRQMHQIASVGREIDGGFSSAVRQCSDQTFVKDAAGMFRSIGGKPGDAALEIYRDLDKDIATAEAFLDRWSDRSGPGYEVILDWARRLHEGLLQLKSNVEEAGPGVMADAKGRIAAVRGSGRDPAVTVPHCYLCAKEGHIREMELVENVMVDMRKWDKPWGPTQNCFQCKSCGRLTCWTHSDNRKPCECGALDWVERMYLQKELDNG